ncbi:CBS domain-containing protein [Streptomyces sp. SUK 48]|uniref:CBS domain-containing protein n=1 Tax=Streptomyces sp. SUK 48 TaxID=2582831 RepID=UPI00129A45BC|nr:CBS domain-containing protein [Streptomyces sp. SUK 48]
MTRLPPAGPPPGAPSAAGQAAVGRLMTAPPVTVAPDVTLAAATRLMSETAVGSLLVVEDGTLRGIVTDRDLALPVPAEGRPVGVLTLDDLLLDVFRRLADLLGPVAWSVLREPPGPP